MRKFVVLAVVVFALAKSLSAYAQETLVDMEKETARLFGFGLSEEMAKEKNLQLKFEIDAFEARGLTQGSTGIIIIPVEDMKEETEDPAADTEAGSGFAYLFMSDRYRPTTKGKKVDPKKLRILKLSAGDREINVVGLLLAARRISEEDWRMYVYGADKKPLIDAKFKMAEKEQKGPIAVHAVMDEEDDEKFNLVVTVFGKYAATIPISSKEDKEEAASTEEEKEE